MTKLIIKQKDKNTLEYVNHTTIHKLYNAAHSVPEPNAGEEDNAQLFGTLQTEHAYRDEVAYLTGSRFPDLTITVTNGYYIHFVDPAIESYLKTTVGDGSGVTETAAQSANLGTYLKGKTDIVNFPEFKYFTSANTNPGDTMFYGCTNLESIDLTNCIKIGTSQFDKCSNLTGIDVQKVTYMGSYSLTENINKIDVLYFKSLTNSSTNTECSFRPDSNSNWVSNPSYEWIGVGVFGKSTIKQMYFPSLVNMNSSTWFSNYQNCRPQFGNNPNTDRATISLLYFKDLQKIYPASFSSLNCTALVIDNNTPPDICNICNVSDSDIGGNMNYSWTRAFVYSNITTVYVPDPTVYQNNSRWSTVSQDQFDTTKTLVFSPISDLTVYSTEEEWIAAGKPLALISEYMN